VVPRDTVVREHFFLGLEGIFLNLGHLHITSPPHSCYQR
jgi:hypothetical protein